MLEEIGPLCEIKILTIWDVQVIKTAELILLSGLQLFRGFLLDAFRVDEFFNFVWRLKDLPRVWGC